jgi:hypothetical protein
MRLFLDIDTREFLQSPSFPRALTSLSLKRRDTDSVELQFVRDRVVREFPSTTIVRLGLKADGLYSGQFLSTGVFTKSGTGTATKYTLGLELNTVALNSAFSAANEPEKFQAMLEVEWTSGTIVSSSLTLPVTIYNDVIRGDEGTPATLPLFYTSSTSDFKATQSQAETGTDNNTWMTPLRTKQAVAQTLSEPLSGIKISSQFTMLGNWVDATYSGTGYNAGNGGFNFEESWLKDYLGNLIIGWPDEDALNFGNRTLKNLGAPAEANDAVRKVDVENAVADVTQLISQISDDLTGPPTWDSVTGKPTTFTPASHTHAISQVTGLQSALDGKQAAGSYVTVSGGLTAIAVVTALPANPSPTTLYIVTS